MLINDINLVCVLLESVEYQNEIYVVLFVELSQRMEEAEKHHEPRPSGSAMPVRFFTRDLNAIVMFSRVSPRRCPLTRGIPFLVVIVAFFLHETLGINVLNSERVYSYSTGFCISYHIRRHDVYLHCIRIFF